MAYTCLHDKERIEGFLRKDVYLHIYSLGDLDPFFWQHTTWYGYEVDANLEAIALIYAAPSLPALLGFSNNPPVMADLLEAVCHLFPRRFYAHLSPGVASALSKDYDLESHGEFYKMALTDTSLASQADSSGVEGLGMENLRAIQTLYAESYPGNWFDPRMLETGQYFGIMDGENIASIAGIHVYSPQYKVAALGNITTHPSYRKKGYGRRVTARLCQSLLDEDIQVGLNVKADNTAAISCYEKLGFTVIATYEEFMVDKK
jgi:ribosomal protein S18 acetylase RimI-like enzyme